MVAGSLRAQAAASGDAEMPADLPAVLQPWFGRGEGVRQWVPTPHDMVSRMLQAARVGPQDLLVDLGSGDGRIVLAAVAQFGARAMGIELTPALVTHARAEAQRLGLAERVQFIQGDLFEQDFSAASVVTAYLPVSVNRRLRPVLLRMKPGTRVLSHYFAFEHWPADVILEAPDRQAYLWIVPARVGGAWHLQLADQPLQQINLQQQFQRVRGQLIVGDQQWRLPMVQLQGDRITLILPRADGSERMLRGRVSSDGRSLQGDAPADWQATRIEVEHADEDAADEFGPSDQTAPGG